MTEAWTALTMPLEATSTIISDRAMPIGRAIWALAFVVGLGGACGGASSGARDAADASDAAPVDAADDACGAITGSCGSNDTGIVICTDYTFVDDSMFRATCTNGNGTWAATACDHTGAVRACRTTQTTGCSTVWFGDSFEAEQMCMGPGAQLIIPATAP
jgi:hypothetical protein